MSRSVDLKAGDECAAWSVGIISSKAIGTQNFRPDYMISDSGFGGDLLDSLNGRFCVRRRNRDLENLAEFEFYFKLLH